MTWTLGWNLNTSSENVDQFIVENVIVDMRSDAAARGLLRSLLDGTAEAVLLRMS